jgi:acyl-homoserine lactone acylase PvdQ
MTHGRLARLLDTHGPRPERWPPADRQAAATLLAASAEARAMLAEARRLEDRLGAVLPQPAPDSVARLKAAVAQGIARSPLPAPPGRWSRLLAALRPAAPAGWGALAAMTCCALWLGLTASPSRTGDPLAPLQVLPIAEDSL